MSDDPKKPKPKKGNPSWPSGQKSLSQIERKRRKEAGTDLKAGGITNWKPWSLNSAARQGQKEMFPDQFPPAEPTVLRQKGKDLYGRPVFVERKKPKPRSRRRMGVWAP